MPAKIDSQNMWQKIGMPEHPFIFATLNTGHTLPATNIMQSYGLFLMSKIEIHGIGNPWIV